MPICREIRCKDPEKVPPLETQVSTHSVGGVAHYSCPRGYYMEGNETRICLQNGSWSGSMPACFGNFSNSLCEIWIMRFCDYEREYL